MMVMPVEPLEPVARTLPRTRLFLSAMIRFDRVSGPVRLRDLSTSGARIDGPRLPTVGTTAHISRGAHHASGTIVWRDSRGCGLQFDEPLDLESWTPGLVARNLVDDDDSGMGARSGAADVQLPSSPALSPNTLRAKLPERVAEELAYVGRLLESFGNDMGGDPLLAMRYPEQVRNLDTSAQILAHLAAVLIADRPDQAIEAIELTALRKRLQRTAL